jgi:hypothetical protein
MTTKDEALALAMYTLEELRKNPALKYEHTFVDAAITAIKQAQAQQAQEPVELKGIKETIAEGQGFWASCTGCFETNEGHAPRGSYFSKVFNCHLGNGCRECGGIGAIWDTTDYDAMADAMGKDLDTHPAPKQAEPQKIVLDK